MHQKVSRFLWDNVISEIERLFDEYISPDTIYKIDRLELNLGILKPEQLTNHVFIERLMECLRIELKAVKEKGSVTPYSRITVSQNSFDQWIYFLQNGYLPWQLDKPGSKWTKNILDTLALNSIAIEKLQNTVIHNQNSLQRIIFQHNDHFLCSITEIFSGHEQKKLMPVLEELDRLISGKINTTKKDVAWEKRSKPILYFGHLETDVVRADFWKEILTKAIVHERRNSWNNYAIDAVQKIFSASEIENIVNSPKIRTTQLAALLLPLKKALEPEKRAPKRRVQKENKKGNWKIDAVDDVPKVGNPQKNDYKKSRAIADVDGEKKVQRSVVNSNKSSDQNNDEENRIRQKSLVAKEEIKESNDSVWYINNAGLVLFNPFFEHLFSKLQFIEKNKFRSSRHQQKAIQLVSYLQSGISDFPEYSLVLPKLVCNYPFSSPVTKSSLLSYEEMMEGDNLLLAVQPMN